MWIVGVRGLGCLRSWGRGRRRVGFDFEFGMVGGGGDGVEAKF
jgi:hypothetical protein